MKMNIEIVISYRILYNVEMFAAENKFSLSASLSTSKNYDVSKHQSLTRLTPFPKNEKFHK